jgi:hypothetical protein
LTGGGRGGAKSVAFDERQLYEYYGAPQPDGVTEKSLLVTLPRNAWVRKYEVVMTAATAHAVTAGDAGQVRTTAIAGGVSVVLDFGTPRTVSAIAAPDGVLIESISTWLGTEFGSSPKYAAKPGSSYVTLPSEVRTERLLVVVSAGASTESLATEMLLVLPESPAGIQLSIDGGPAIFAQAAAVDPNDSAELSAQAWNGESRRVVDLGPALAALTGNPQDESSVSFTITLSSRVPGKLDLALRDGGQDVLRIRRATFNGQSARELVFDAEGRQACVLTSLPAGVGVQEVRFSVSGRPPALRVVPPLGPEPAVPAFASFSLSSERAACLRLPEEPRFRQLHGVRIPLGAGGAGAEAQVLLWRSKDLLDASPHEPLENGASEPVTIEGTAEDFRTFAFKKPVAMPSDCVLWAVLLLTRGVCSLLFADASAGSGAERFLWGAATGPWHDLPSPLGASRGRVRLIGQAEADTPFPPLGVQLAGNAASLLLTPNVKGIAAVLQGLAGATDPPTLLITSHAPLALTLKDIDVISIH